jgi:hypothetical protein
MIMRPFESNKIVLAMWPDSGRFATAIVGVSKAVRYFSAG